jgi:hypothetical protein
MKHIRYLSSADTLCEIPESLGKDYIVVDYGDDFPCRECSALLMEHNRKSYEAELAVGYNAKHAKRVFDDYPEISVLQVWVSALAITSGFWLGLFLVLWWWLA